MSPTKTHWRRKCICECPRESSERLSGRLSENIVSSRNRLIVQLGYVMFLLSHRKWLLSKLSSCLVVVFKYIAKSSKVGWSSAYAELELFRNFIFVPWSRPNLWHRNLQKEFSRIWSLLLVRKTSFLFSRRNRHGLIQSWLTSFSWTKSQSNISIYMTPSPCCQTNFWKVLQFNWKYLSTSSFCLVRIKLLMRSLKINSHKVLGLVFSINLTIP